MICFTGKIRLVKGENVNYAHRIGIVRIRVVRIGVVRKGVVRKGEK